MTQLRIAEAPVRRDLAGPALRAFFNIAGLTDSEVSATNQKSLRMLAHPAVRG